MTNEEAIKRLKEFKILHTEQAGWDVTTQKALDMAIEALEQEPCEDAISREDLIQKFNDDVFIRDKTDSKEDYQQVFASTVFAVIKSLPSVTPQRNTRYWIGQKKIGFGKYKEYIVPLKDGFVTGSCHYCPYCGAEMAESEEGI